MNTRHSTYNVTISFYQQGAALIVSLLFLLIMTIIGLAGIQVTSLEEKMTGNMRDRSLAFQAAESALRTGESFLSQATFPVFSCSSTSDGLYQYTCSPSVLLDSFWQGTDKLTYPGTALGGLAANPQYVMEELAPVTESGGSLEAGTATTSSYYRITARGTGGTANAVVLLQSIFKR
jgi:type IV pilus assembly protein PilX